MSRRSLILFLLAIGVSFGTAQLVRGYIADSSSSIAESQQMTHVLVAAKNITPGHFIRAENDLQWVPWPAGTAHESFLVQGKVNPDDYNGAVARRKILKGEPVMDKTLVQADEGGFMAAVLTPGMRAVSIAVNSTTGNAGFIFPGDRVDLILTLGVDLESSRKNVLAGETFLENARVLAVDQKLDNPENRAILAKTVTLEVSKVQAEKISVAKEIGKISLSLRSLAHDAEKHVESNAKNRTPTRASDVSAVLVPRDIAEVERVVVIRGSEREELEFGQ